MPKPKEWVVVNDEPLVFTSPRVAFADMIEALSEPPEHWPEEMKSEWRKDRAFLLGDSW